MFKLTATHGVHLDDIGAHFQRDTSAEGAVYRYETDDALQVAALLKVDGYGITADEDTVKAAEKAAAAKAKADKEAAEREAAEVAAAEKAAAAEADKQK